MKAILALFLTAMALMMTWTAAWLAIDAHHAWRVTTTLLAFLFAIGAIITFIIWVMEWDEY